MHRHASERSQIPNINTALANTSYVPTPTATPNSPVSLSRFPSTTSTLATTTTTTTATSGDSGKSSSGSSNPQGAVRVVTLLNALGPALGAGSPRPQALFQGPSPQAPPSPNPPVRFHQTWEVEISPPMAVPIASPKKTHFLDRFSGSPSVGTSSSSLAAQPDKAVRMVGRGGSGSKLRSVKSVPSAVPDVTRVKSNTSSAGSSAKNGKVRYVGRGGQGSRHKRAKEEGEEAQDDGSGVGLKLPWKKVKKSQSKRTLDSGTEGSMNSEDYDYYLRPRLSNSSGGTLTTLNTPSSPSFSHDLGGVSVSSLEHFGLESYGVSVTRRNPMTGSKSADASLNKVAKQMGELPPHLIYQQLLQERHGSSGVRPLPIAPRLDTRNLGHRHTPSAPSIIVSEEPTPTSTQRRALEVPPSFGSGSAYSLAPSFETSASCELHRFGLGDDMSDTWGKVRDSGEGRHCYSDNAGLEDEYDAPSPITFSPPTPVDRRKGPARCNVCHIETGMEPEEDAISEFSVTVSDTDSGFGYTANGSGIDGAMAPPSAEVSNLTTSGAPCGGHHAHAVGGVAVRSSQSPPALGQPETHAHTHAHTHTYSHLHSHSHLQVGSPTMQNTRVLEAGWRRPEPDDDDDMKTPIVERGYGADSFGKLAKGKVKAKSPSSSEASLRSAEALSGHSTSVSSTPGSVTSVASKDDIFESKYLPPLPSPAPSTTSFASSIGSASSLPYASTQSSEPSRSRPETPFGNLTRLLVPAPSGGRLDTGGSTSSTASNSSASHLAVGSKRHLGQARRLSISADSFDEDVIVLVGSVQSRRRRSVNWGPGSVGIGAPEAPHREEPPTAAVVSVEQLPKKEKKSGKKQAKQPDVWTGEWNTDMGDVIKALRAL